MTKHVYIASLYLHSTSPHLNHSMVIRQILRLDADAARSIFPARLVSRKAELVVLQEIDRDHLDLVAGEPAARAGVAAVAEGHTLVVGAGEGQLPDLPDVGLAIAAAALQRLL